MNILIDTFVEESTFTELHNFGAHQQRWMIFNFFLIHKDDMRLLIWKKFKWNMAGVEKSSFSLFNVWQFYNGYPQLKIWPGRYRLSNFFLSCNCISDCLNVRKYTAANTSTSWSWNAAQASPNFLCRIIGNYEINSRDIINTLTFSSILTQILQNISTFLAINRLKVNLS